MLAGRNHAFRKRAGRPLRFAIMAALAAGLSACGGLTLFGESGPPPRVYDLSPKSTFDPGLPSVDWQLVVEEPFAAGTVNTDRIAARSGAFEFVYYENVRWSSRAPVMIQTRLVESFENSGRITSVGRQAIGLRSDFELKSELREFQALLRPGAPEIWVRMNFKLVEQPSAQIVASMTADRRVRAVDDSMDAIVSAFDSALGGVLKESVSWTLVAAEQHDRRRRAKRFSER